MQDLKHLKESDWVFNESALTPLIKELKEKKRNHACFNLI